MNIIEKLATTLGRRDEVPNQELAAEILRAADEQAVAELIANLSNKNKGIRYDCIKVLYEIGYVEPKLIAEHAQVFLGLLESKDNRLQWGAMTALGCIARVRPDDIFASLSRIIDAADRGSVITRDHCVNILISLSAIDRYANMAFPLFLEQMTSCPANQFPMYAEKAQVIVNTTNKQQFIKVLSSRLGGLETESQRKRIEKVLKKLNK